VLPSAAVHTAERILSCAFPQGFPQTTLDNDKRVISCKVFPQNTIGQKKATCSPITFLLNSWLFAKCSCYLL